MLLPAGVTICGTIRLQSHVHIELPAGSVLRASSDPAEFRDGVWIQAEGCTDVSVRGPGRLVGNRSDHFQLDLAALTKWIADGRPTGAVKHPVAVMPLRYTFMLQFVNCDRISLTEVAIEDSQHWTIHFLACDNVTCERVRVKNQIYGPYTDGFDIDGCNNVVVRDCEVTAGDDAFCIKNTNQRGLARASQNILIEGCVARSPTNGFKIGTETHQDISNVTFRRCRVEPPFLGVAALGGVTITTVDDGNVFNVAVLDVRMTSVRTPMFVRLGNRGAAAKANARPGSLQQVTVRGVTVDACEAPITLVGLADHPIRDVRIERVTVRQRTGAVPVRELRDIPENPTAYPEATMFGSLPAVCLFARHVSGLTLDEVRCVTSEAQQGMPLATFDDVIRKTGDVEGMDGKN